MDDWRDNPQIGMVIRAGNFTPIARDPRIIVAVNGDRLETISLSDPPRSGWLTRGSLRDYELALTPTAEPFLEITDEMCAAALKAERGRRWHSDELRVWAMLAAARDAVVGCPCVGTPEQEDCPHG